ncbi:MAG: serine hydrolase [Isosphaeraceae bacterium]|nr:serine hydrolase [Isosphaeraceae bacterium]
MRDCVRALVVLSVLGIAVATPAFGSSPLEDGAAEVVFPREHWESREPRALGLDPAELDALARELGGRGCVVKDGWIVKSWGDQAVRRDWASSAKPVLSTLLFFALAEGRVRSVDQPIADFGWELLGKDRGITFRHLGAMTSGYARPDAPGEAWAYNDFAINLYQKTLFERVFRGDPGEVANAPQRFGALGLEDGLAFRPTNRRMSASVRDFARIGWFWLNRGVWDGRRVLPAEVFDDHFRPQVPRDLRRSAPGATNDVLGIGTYGGGSDHFTEAGPGIYGFNWWFNARGREHPNAKTWPDAPDDLVMTLGVRGNSSAILPSARAVLVAAEANWGELEPGKVDSRQNQILRRFVAAVTPKP